MFLESTVNCKKHYIYFSHAFLTKGCYKLVYVYLYVRVRSVCLSVCSSSGLDQIKGHDLSKSYFRSKVMVSLSDRGVLNCQTNFISTIEFYWRNAIRHVRSFVPVVVRVSVTMGWFSCRWSYLKTPLSALPSSQTTNRTGYSWSANHLGLSTIC